MKRYKKNPDDDRPPSDWEAAEILLYFQAPSPERAALLMKMSGYRFHLIKTHLVDIGLLMEGNRLYPTFAGKVWLVNYVSRRQ